MTKDTKRSQHLAELRALYQQLDTTIDEADRADICWHIECEIDYLARCHGATPEEIRRALSDGSKETKQKQRIS